MASKELIVKIKGDNSDFKKSMNEVSTQTKSVKDKFAGFTSALGKVAIAAGVAYGAFQSGRAVIESQSGASDKLARITEGLTMSFQQLSRQLLDLDFSNFVDNIVEANRVGKELSDRLDDLEDRTRSLNITASEYEATIAALREDASDETTSLEGKIASIKEAIRLQEELNQKVVDNATQAKEIALDRLSFETKLSKEQIIAFLRQYNDQETLRNQALAWIDEYKKNVAIAGKENVENLIQRFKDGFGGISKGPLFESNQLVEMYARNIMQYAEGADTSINSAVDAIVKFNNAAAQGSMAMKGLNRQLNGLTPNVKPSTAKTALPSLSSIQSRTNFQIPQKSQIEPLIGLVDQLTVSWQSFGETVERLDISGKFKEFTQITIDIGKELEYLAEGAVVSFAESIGSAFSGNGGLKAGLDSILLMFADWAGNLGKIIIASAIAIDGIKKFALANPWAAVALGVALVATAAAIKGAVGQKPVGKGGGGGGSSSQNNEWDAFGLRGIRGMTVEVNGVLKAQGKDLVAVIKSENNRKGL